METLRQHFRPEFLNRIDDIIVFHSLSQEQIKDIVSLQLERVKRMARAQDVYLEFDDSLIEHLSQVGYQPEFGARALKRIIRTEVETKLAESMLKADIKEGCKVKLRYDQSTKTVVFDKVKEPAEKTTKTTKEERKRKIQ